MKSTVIQIDGSLGEGGGQILRSALALSLVTQKPFQIKNIRANRNKPGLMRQHLTAVQAAAEIGQAKVEAEIGATRLSFSPGEVVGGSYHFAVGTAGSGTLVLQTILPPLLVCAKPSEITIEGGTHNPYAPPFDYLVQSFLPLVNKLGPKVTGAIKRYGFYPAGGGKFKVTITPSKKLEGLELIERGGVKKCEAKALVSNLPMHIAQRETKIMAKNCAFEGTQIEVVEIENAKGPGNIALFTVESDHVTETFTAFGEQRVTASTVADRAVRGVNRYLAAGVPVGPHLADQLLLPLAMAQKGKFVTVKPTKHTMTNIEIIQRFLDVTIGLTELDRDKVLVTIAPKA